MNNDNQEVKAVTEVAKTTGKVLDAVHGLGEFVASFIGGPLEQASGIAEDRLKYFRWERKIRMMRRADEFMKEQDLDFSGSSIRCARCHDFRYTASLSGEIAWRY